MPSLVALVPARAGSERVPGKNVRPLGGHPLLAYSIAAAQQSGVADRVVCSTDSEEIAAIARWYGADVPFLRPAEYATSTSPDIEWIVPHARRAARSATSCSRSSGRRARSAGLPRSAGPRRAPRARRRPTRSAPSSRSNSIPGRCGCVEGETMRPLLDQSRLDVPWHDSQFQALPAGLRPDERARDRLDAGRRRGHARRERPAAASSPRGTRASSIDHEEDWARAEALLAAGEAVLPRIDVEPWRG